ncbi:MAG: lytic murein transglycosylase [Alphaproteobacteria bacterium]|nr:lytic murein transglycosylase [Alphaproteobacteria bacterium]
MTSSFPFPCRALALLAFAIAMVSSSMASAQALSQSSFEAYLQYVAAKARSEGVSEKTISRTLSGLTFNQRVVDLDQGQPGRQNVPPPLAPYLSRHIDSAKIRKGKARLAQVAPRIPQVQQRYGLPLEVVTAIWGHETNYGSYTGDFDLARSLASLAYEGRRRTLFEGELIALMKMVDRGVPLSRMKGSWAGAFGYPQFLPSVYLTNAVDADGDGFADIWGSAPDTLASISNYFVKAGWRHGQAWGVGAGLPAGFDAARFPSRLAPPSCTRVHDRHSTWKTVDEWRALGVRPLGAIPGDALTTLFQPDGPGTRAWLLTGNYRVILQYNCSNYYAMSVGLLADEIAR